MDDYSGMQGLYEALLLSLLNDLRYGSLAVRKDIHKLLESKEYCEIIRVWTEIAGVSSTKYFKKLRNTYYGPRRKW